MSDVWKGCYVVHTCKPFQATAGLSKTSSSLQSSAYVGLLGLLLYLLFFLICAPRIKRDRLHKCTESGWHWHFANMSQPDRLSKSEQALQRSHLRDKVHL